MPNWGNYYSKLKRDRLREELKSETIITDYALYYFDGTEATVVAEGVNGESHVFWASDKPVIVFSVCNEPVDLKIKLSEISAAFEVRDPVWAALEASSRSIHRCRFYAVRHQNRPTLLIFVFPPMEAPFFSSMIFPKRETAISTRLILPTIG